MIRPERTALLATAVALVVFPTAATGELRPADLSRGGASGSTPRIASDGAGNTVVVWREVDGDTSAIRAAVRPAGGSWASAERISAPAPATESPRLAMDRLGNAVAVWQRSNGHDSVVQAAIRPAGGAWSPPQDLSAPGEPAFNADVALEAGQVTAVWTVLRDRRTAVETSSAPVAGSWGPVQTLSGPIGNASTPVVAVDDEGAAVAAWRWADGAYLVVQAASRSRMERGRLRRSCPGPAGVRPAADRHGRGRQCSGGLASLQRVVDGSAGRLPSGRWSWSRRTTSPNAVAMRAGSTWR